MSESLGEHLLYEVLREEYPNYVILRQQPIKTSIGTLFLDFYIPSLQIALEFDGIQHRKYSAFYHRNNPALFKAGQDRDVVKNKYCEDNGITLIRISDQEEITREVLREKVKNSIRDQI